MNGSSSTAPPPRIAVVLSGGGARGAYEVGVLRFLRRELPKRLGHMPRIDIFSGTSVGAINAAFMAATCDEPTLQAEQLRGHWQDLRLEKVIDFSAREIVRALKLLLGGVPPPPRPGELRRGGLLSTIGLERLVIQVVPWERISRNLRAGHLSALSVSATHVATGKTMVFVERAGGGLPPWSKDPSVEARAARIGPLHVLGSAAIPVLFPAVSIDGTFYADGGLRQNTPLSPALRLGADRVLVISLKHLGGTPKGATLPQTTAPSTETPRGLPPMDEERNVEAYPSPWFVFGKALNALLLDHTDYDLDRLSRLNAMIDGGIRAFGDRFVEEINGVLMPLRGQGVRMVQPLLVRPSQDIGYLAAEYARSPRLLGLPGVLGRTLRYLAGSAQAKEADLLSYLLFDGEFATELIELGERDARAQEESLLHFFHDAAPM